MASSSDLSSHSRSLRGALSLEHEKSSKGIDVKDVACIHNLPLYKAVDKGDWAATKRFLEGRQDLLTASLSEDGDTVLHIAVLAGHIDIVEELLKLLEAQDLTITNKNRATALNYAAIGGITRIAEVLVKKNKGLLGIPNQNDQIPVVVASLYGHKEIVGYLYRKTPVEELSPEMGKNGAMLLTSCIIDERYDIALDLLQHHPQLAFQRDSDNDTALGVLAQKPSAFLSGSPLSLWKRWIYNGIRIPQPNGSTNFHGDIERPHGEASDRRNANKRTFDRLMVMFWKSLKVFNPAIKHMYNRKLAHSQAQELLCFICQQLATVRQDFKRIGVHKAVFDAVEHGIVEFIVEITDHFPEIIWIEDDFNRGIFLYAALQRQEKIFSLLYRMGAKKHSMATSWDKKHNNILHQAAFLAPSRQLDRVSGAALQMQWELQWYKEVERIVQPKYREMINMQHKTPRVLFTESHKKLVEEGEKWMKDTAGSCTVVAALIATIMFSALFTAPGGYDQYSGVPIFLDRNSFMVFIVSDAMSLFASSTSLLMFLGVLTARYTEEDFLVSLPTKLIIGLSTLFFSIATMMVTFGVTLVLTLRDRISWVSFPIVMLASLPVTLFALLQFPLLIEIFFSTYGPGIFDKLKKRRCFSAKRRRQMP